MDGRPLVPAGIDWLRPTGWFRQSPGKGSAMTPTGRVLGMCALAGVAALVAGPPAARAAPAGKPSERVRELQGERLKALEEQVEGMDAHVKLRPPRPSELAVLVGALTDLAEAELDLADGRAAEVAVLERAVQRFRKLEEEMENLVAGRLLERHAAAHVRAARLKAEIHLEKRRPAK
jgi:hypothetical protein